MEVPDLREMDEIEEDLSTSDEEEEDIDEEEEEDGTGQASFEDEDEDREPDFFHKPEEATDEDNEYAR